MHNETHLILTRQRPNGSKNLNWDDYRYFLAVVRSGKLIAAGQQLGVDHATVSRRIKALEATLGINLFDRSPQGYSPTDEGLNLVAIAEAMESGAIAAQTRIGGLDDTISGVVRIGTSEGIATSILSECASDLCKSHPELELQIVTVPRTFSLSKREADIAIAISKPTSGRLKFRKISDYTLHLYATQGYLDKYPEIRRIEDLKEVHGIGYVPDLIYDKELDCISELGDNFHPNFTSNSVNVQLEATLAGGGVCILHDFMAQDHQELIKVLPDQVSFTRTFWYIVHEDYAKSRRIKTVSDVMIKHIKDRLAS